MKLSSLVLITTVLVIVVGAVSVDAGGRRRRNRRRKLKQCVYQRKGQRGECDLNTGNMEVTFKLKASRQRFDCPPTMIKVRKCAGCKFLKKSVEFGECVDGSKSKRAPLAPDSDPKCPPFRLISRKCRDGKRKGNGKRKGKRKGKGRRRGRKGCVYQNKDWSECDVATNTRQRVRILVAGDKKACHPKKVVTKKCRKACRYLQGEWSDCDNVTNSKNRTLTPKAGSQPQCESKVQTKDCFVGADSQRGRPTKCRYKFGVWSECDTRTNTMTRDMNLRKGDPNLCKRNAKQTRKCRPACKFRQGIWSACDKMTRLMTRLDKLVKGNPKHCEKQREITKKCKKSKCKYTLGPWSECSPDTKLRQRAKTLVKGDKDKCKAEMTMTKPCFDKNGEARCFFGSWGEFGPCTNGVMTKQRVMIQGGMECERKAVVAKACDA